MFGVILRTDERIPRMDLIILSTNQDFQKEMYTYKNTPKHRPHNEGAVQLSTVPQDSIWVLGTMTRLSAAPGVKQYVIKLSLEHDPPSNML